MNRKIVYIVMIMVAVALLYLPPRPVSGYESKGKRDPFVPLVGQDKGSNSAGLEGIISINDVILEGIAIGHSGKNVAILNGQMVKEKEKFGLLQIRKISKKTVELSIDGKVYKLSLQDEKGIKVGE
ncbi:MAG: hypothetical protein WC482_03935 [Candidatus Omnitrophota bacterium]|nr:hypothetical protein [Candidatus Omnitrophota bacterium]